MKAFRISALAAMLVLGSVASAFATDFRMAGQYDFAFSFYNNAGTFADGEENDFTARQRLRAWVDFISSESLRGQFYIEVGETNWGNADQGGALGTDGKTIEVRRAFIDWKPPVAYDTTIRLGLQGLALPAAVAGSPVFDDDVAAATVTTQFTENVGLIAAWARPWDESTGVVNQNDGKDEIDMFILALPIQYQSLNITPWGVYTLVGDDSPLYGDFGDFVWWAGVAAQLTFDMPLTVKADFMYGATDSDNAAGESQRGWMVAAAADYKFDRVTPGIFGWYGSGSGNNNNRVMPVVSPAGFAPTSFGFDGSNTLQGSPYVSESGAGMWGIGAQLADISFIEDLSHVVRVAYYRGTSKTGRGVEDAGNWPIDKDLSAWEINFDSTYAIYDNFLTFVELGYIGMDVKDTSDEEDGWKLVVGLRYNF